MPKLPRGVAGGDPADVGTPLPVGCTVLVRGLRSLKNLHFFVQQMQFKGHPFENFVKSGIDWIDGQIKVKFNKLKQHQNSPFWAFYKLGGMSFFFSILNSVCLFGGPPENCRWKGFFSLHLCSLIICGWLKVVMELRYRKILTISVYS